MLSKRRREVGLRSLFRTRSRAMRTLLATVEKIVDHDVSRLIIGESRVGKNYMAEALHACGARK